MELQNIEKYINIDEIKNHIINTSVVAWDGVITETKLNKWLNNFDGRALGDINAEKAIAAWLLLNFTFFNKAEIEELCRVIYKKYLSRKLEDDYYELNERDRNDRIREILSSTLFLSLGNPSESGAHILYIFRKVNNLPKGCFDLKDIKGRIERGDIRNLVLLDDVMISGEQAKGYLQEHSRFNCNIYVVTLFNTNEAIREITNNYPNIIIDCAQVIDRRAKLFSDESFIFSNSDARAIKLYAEKMCRCYGKYIVSEELPEDAEYMRDYPLGFKDNQMTIGFYYNTPDNTLPIFWCNSKRWVAAFKRDIKVNNIENVEVSDEQYL